MRKKTITAMGTAAAIGAGAVALAAGGTASGAAAPASRLDDGKDLQSQATISEQYAIAAARRAESGSLNEVDLEHYKGTLVYNVDVGAHDVKVDAATGDVLGSPGDD